MLIFQAQTCTSFWQSAEFSKAITGLVSTIGGILALYLWNIRSTMVANYKANAHKLDTAVSQGQVAADHAVVAASVAAATAQKVDTVVRQTDGLNTQLQVKLDAQTVAAQHQAEITSLQTEIAVLKKNGGTDPH